jgi:tetratricopeptide (TPR) repeat protein
MEHLKSPEETNRLVAEVTERLHNLTGGTPADPEKYKRGMELVAKINSAEGEAQLKLMQELKDLYYPKELSDQPKEEEEIDTKSVKEENPEVDKTPDQTENIKKRKLGPYAIGLEIEKKQKENEKGEERIRTRDELLKEEMENKAREIYIKSAEKCVETGEIETAAKYYQKAGDTKKANEMYVRFAEKRERKGYLDDAAKYYLKAGDIEKANEMYTRLAEIDERGGHPDYAAKYYLKAGNIKKANEMYIRTAKYYEKDTDGFKSTAVEYYLKAGEIEKAKEVCIRFAEKLVKEGRAEDAIKWYRKASKLEEQGKK